MKDVTDLWCCHLGDVTEAEQGGRITDSIAVALCLRTRRGLMLDVVLPVIETRYAFV